MRRLVAFGRAPGRARLLARLLAPSSLVTSPLRRSQLVEPAHLPLHRLEAVTLQFEGVAVETLAGAGERRPHALPALLQPAAPTLEDAQAHVDPGVAEEREVDAEVLV